MARGGRLRKALLMDQISKTKLEDAREARSALERTAVPADRPRPGHVVTAEEMGNASFPASDPPATWTWDPR